MVIIVVVMTKFVIYPENRALCNIARVNSVLAICPSNAVTYWMPIIIFASAIVLYQLSCFALPQTELLLLQC
jgi:hypothetical protein